MSFELRPPWGSNRGDHSRKLPWTLWLELIGQIKARETTVSEVSRVYGVARLNVYKKIWRYERYMNSQQRNDRLVKAFVSSLREGERTRQ